MPAREKSCAKDKIKLCDRRSRLRFIQSLRVEHSHNHPTYTILHRSSFNAERTTETIVRLWRESADRRSFSTKCLTCRDAWIPTNSILADFTGCHWSFPTAHRSAGEKLPRFSDSNSQGSPISLKQKKFLLPSAGGRANQDETYNISAVPLYRNVSTPNNVHIDRDSGSVTEEYESRELSSKMTEMTAMNCKALGTILTKIMREIL